MDISTVGNVGLFSTFDGLGPHSAGRLTDRWVTWLLKTQAGGAEGR